MKVKTLLTAVIALVMSFNVLAQDFKTQAAEVLNMMIQAQSAGTTLDTFPADQQTNAKAFIQAITNAAVGQIQEDAKAAGYTSDEALQQYLSEGVAFKQLVANLKTQEANILSADKTDQFIFLVFIEVNLDIQQNYYFPYAEESEELEASSNYIAGLYKQLATSIGFKTTQK